MPRSALSFASILTALAAACSCGHDRAPRAAATPSSQRADPAPASSSALAPQQLVLEQHDGALTIARYAPAVLSASPSIPLALGPAHSLAALERTDAPGVQRTVRAQNRGRFAHVARVGSEHTLFVHATLSDEHPKRVPLGTMVPHAMLMTETGLFIGSATQVSYVDLEAETLQITTLVSREGNDRKAYDVFARAGDRVVAIDDVVRPIYADFFGLAAHGAPAHLAGWDMPSLINGKYVDAVLVPEAEGNHTLFVVAPYGVIDGNGQVLASIPILGTRLGTVDEVLNSGASRARVLEEHQSRAEGMPSHFVAGDTLTLWSGLAFAHDRVFLAAGPRGLFVLPKALGAGVVAQVVAAEMEIHDVTMLDGRVFVLAKSGESHLLIELGVGAEGVTLGTRTPLPEPFNRFVD